MTTTYEPIPLTEGMAQAEKEAEKFLHVLPEDVLLRNLFLQTVRAAYSAGYVQGQYGRRVK